MSPRPAITALFTDLYEITMALGLFTDEFVQQLSEVRFTGDVWAVPEGTVVFSNEPILQVIAQILEAQLVETFVVNQIHLQSVIASKAARVRPPHAGHYCPTTTSPTACRPSLEMQPGGRFAGGGLDIGDCQLKQLVCQVRQRSRER